MSFSKTIQFRQSVETCLPALKAVKEDDRSTNVAWERDNDHKASFTSVRVSSPIDSVKETLLVSEIGFIDVAHVVDYL